MSSKKITDQLVNKVAGSAVEPGIRLHVIPREGKWVVRKNGSSKATGIYQHIEDAISAATTLVKNGKIQFALVHDSTGKIIEKID